MLFLNTTLIRRTRGRSFINLNCSCFEYMGEINNNCLILWSELTELNRRLITLPDVGISHAGVG